MSESDCGRDGGRDGGSASALIQEETPSESKEVEPENRTYVTYFQSVTTLCVFTAAKNQEEAMIIAKRKISVGDISDSVLDRLPFVMEKTEKVED